MLLLRDSDICSQCGRCNSTINGFSNSYSVEISDHDLKKPHVIDALEIMILVCESGAISIEK